MEKKIIDRIQKWLNSDLVEALSKETIIKLQNNKEEEKNLLDAFACNLSFGTGGLRGIMGVGDNRMNQYTVGMATQGFANYIKKNFINTTIKVVISYDSRNQSPFFASVTAAVFAANGFEVYLFSSLRPTPELSFAIRMLSCHAGVMCTASHNPKEYNGYKAYWNDGSQLVPPHDIQVIKEVEAIQDFKDVKWKGNEENIHFIDQQIDDAYITMVKTLRIHPVDSHAHPLHIIYTPLHGTGITLVPKALKEFGFTKVEVVVSQSIPDGNFPTVVYPNPEEKEAMHLGLQQAMARKADILLGTDPDADRVAVGVKDDQGQWILLNGNQTAALLVSYMLEERIKNKLATPNDMVISTIVTTPLLEKIAHINKVAYYEVLTGFKWIAEVIRKKEGKENFIVGGEESFGLLVGDQVRDKDAISAVAMICEMASIEKQKKRTLFDRLIEVYIKYGMYKESLVSLTKKGVDGHKEILNMMDSYRKNTPTTINGQSVVYLNDYVSLEQKDMRTQEVKKIDLPQSDVLQFVLADQTKISIRPSGTEPKIKFYMSVCGTLTSKNDYAKVQQQLQDKIDAIKKEMKWE